MAPDTYIHPVTKKVRSYIHKLIPPVKGLKVKRHSAAPIQPPNGRANSENIYPYGYSWRRYVCTLTVRIISQLIAVRFIVATVDLDQIDYDFLSRITRF